jgi:hypothetical protein
MKKLKRRAKAAKGEGEASFFLETPITAPEQW